MSYAESTCDCGWCGARIDGKVDQEVACRKCYEVAEAALAEAQKLIEHLRAEIDNLRKERK